MQKVVLELVDILVESLAYLQELDQKHQELENELLQVLKDLGLDNFIVTEDSEHRYEYRILDNECYKVITYYRDNWIIVDIIPKDVASYIREIIDTLEFLVEIHPYNDLRQKLNDILQDYR